MSDKPKVVFLEVEDWFRRTMADPLREHMVPVFLDGTMEQAPDAELANARVISPFVHSTLDAAQLGRMPRLELVATRSTGFDHIDMAWCAAHNVAVANVPRYGQNTVAEHTFALMLNLTRRVHEAWERTMRGDFSLHGLRGWDLRGKRLGVVGTGSIGLHVIAIARGFLMDVVAFDPFRRDDAADILGYRYVTLDELIETADVISLHCPMTPENHHLLNAQRLARTKKGVLVVNTARGGLIDTAALLMALKSGQVGGAGLDVLEEEDMIAEESELLSEHFDAARLQRMMQNHVLAKHPRVIITPHIGFNSEEAVRRITETTIGNIRAFFAGSPQNVVNSVRTTKQETQP
ncbi:MAG: Glyoxylate/hydroxypyruvate reductase B [Phycisphaerae bacterium]|nr:Glyoxylate/hydroxypyruvate reductase B [Phycisphaerae bacterium]